MIPSKHVKPFNDVYLEYKIITPRKIRFENYTPKKKKASGNLRAP